MDERNVIWPVWTSKTVVAPEPWSQWLAKVEQLPPPLKLAV
jgi:hypothetical protein